MTGIHRGTEIPMSRVSTDERHKYNQMTVAAPPVTGPEELVTITEYFKHMCVKYDEYMKI